jgi:hypothetical protein
LAPFLNLKFLENLMDFLGGNFGQKIDQKWSKISRQNLNLNLLKKFRKSQEKITKCGAVNYLCLIFPIFLKI